MKNINEFEPKKYRDFYSMQELVNTMRRLALVWCWGAHAWTKMNNQLLRFRVNGMLFKGHVYIAVNGADLFDIWFTNLKGEVKQTKNDINIENLVGVIDRVVETK
jgi:hypothetical protein